MLSHYNIGSNIEQMDQVFDLNRHDRFLGILPFFHSFGFTGTLWLPAMLGVGVVFHPNPLDAKAIGPLVKRSRRDLPAGDADVPANLPARLRAGGFRQPAARDDRRGKIARPARDGVRGAFRHPADGRLRLHGMRAGGGGEHPGFPRRRFSSGRRQTRKNRPSAARRHACASWTRKIRGAEIPCRSASPACCSCAGRT